MKTIFIIFSLLIMMLGASCKIMKNKSSQGEIIAFSELKSGQYSAIEEKQFVVLNEPEEYAEFWNKVYSIYHPIPEIPEIDFQNYTLVGVFIGTLSTGGYSVEIIEIIETRGEVFVHYKINQPGANDYVTMALSQPYQMVLIPKTNKYIKPVKID
jgi:hypothetical protein